MGCSSLISSFFEGAEPFFHSRYVHSIEGHGENLWFIAHHEEEGQFLCGGVESLIVTELHDWDEGGPGFGVVRTEDSHVDLEFLVDLFSFSVSLRMIGHASKGFETKDLCNFLEYLRRELWASVREEGVWETKASEHVIDKILDSCLGVNCFVTRNANYPLHR